MTTTRRINRAPGRVAASALASGLVATGSIVVLAPMASAAVYTASDEVSYYAAIVDAMDNPGPDTIVLDADITLTTDDLPLYDSDDDLTLDGAGYSIINGDEERDFGGFHAHEEGPLDGSFVFTDITFSGFTGDWPAIWVDAYGTVELTRVNVENSTGSGAVVLWVGGDVTVTDSTFTDNTADANPSAGLDIDMMHGDGSVTVTGSTFTNNITGQYGGAISVQGDTPLHITGSNFVGNEAEYNGGAVYGSDDVLIENSVFTDNKVWRDDYDGGGAVYADNGAEITSSTFTNNYSAANGGALFAWFESDVTESTFTGNEAGASGGAVYVGEEEFTAYRSTFDSNTAGADGGAAWGYYYADSFDSTWVGNAAGGSGGAIYSDGDNDYSYSWNSTYVGNTAVWGGGAFYSQYDYYETYHSTYSGNSADQGSHVFVADDQMFPYASVFTANAGEGDACFSADGSESWNFNFDEDGTCTDGWGTSDLAPADGSPLLGALGHNGGPTKTMLPAAGSVLIDAIPLDVCEDAIDEDEDLEADQRGVNRAQGSGCDIGAVEVIPALVIEYFNDADEVIATATLTNAVDSECSTTYTLAALGGTPPAGVAFPYGGFDFCISLPGEGWSTTVTWTFAAPVNQMWKIDEGTWSKIESATFSGTTATYTIVDGDHLDLDGNVNGAIYDPVAAGVGASFTG